MSLLHLVKRGFSSTTRHCGRPRNALKETSNAVDAPSLAGTKPAKRRTRTVKISSSTPPAPRGATPGSSSPILVAPRSYAKKNKPTYVSENKFHLPPARDWAAAFPAVGHAFNNRVSLRNPISAARIADAFVPAGSRDKVVVEAFPGPGVLTRALMDLPKERVRKIIVLENLEPYLDFLRPLQEKDPRVHVLPLDGFSWDSYQEVESAGLLKDVDVHPWDCLHPHLHFVTHLATSVYGEQLIAQLLRLIPDQGWLFRYGRVPMSCVMHDWLWERISANTDSYNRCKLSVIAQATASLSEPLVPDALAPYDDHFWPSNALPGEVRMKVTPMTAVSMDPLQEQIIGKGMLDKWDYCLRKLFVLKSTDLRRAIHHLAPGSSALLSSLTDPSLPEDHVNRTDVSKIIRKMEVEEWAAVVRAFDVWPFAPEDLLISGFFAGEDR